MAVPDLQDALDCLQQEDVDGAISTLEDKVEELPAHLTAYVLLARAHESKHQWDQALQAWENVYFLMPNSPVAREGKRRVLRKMDRDEEAEDIEEASPSSPAPTEADSEPSSFDGEAPGEETPEDRPADEESTTTETSPAAEAASELEQLRRQAEDEAKHGGARPEMANTSESPDGDASPSTPQERVDQIQEEDEDLDRLIDELESARIEPSPEVDDAPAPDLENDVDDLVTETLARIHEAQDQYRKAAQIYVKLASQEPDRAREYLEKAAEMRREAEQNAPDDES